jgi:small conductance mechanosensitive channel
MEQYLDDFTKLAWAYGPKILSAILLFIGGLWLIRRLTRGFDVFLRKRKVDESLRPFFTSLADTTMKIALLLVVANLIGLETTSFIAVFSAIAFSVGLALQGSLGNFASGVLILLFRPYKVGDLINVSEKTGKVIEIQIFNTILHTSEGKRIIIPNSKMTEGPIESISETGDIQVEVKVLVDAKTSLDLLRALADEVVCRYQHAVPGKPAEVSISGISRDDMKVVIACWTTGAYYEETLDYMYESLKRAFDAAGVLLAKERRRDNVDVDWDV